MNEARDTALFDGLAKIALSIERLAAGIWLNGFTTGLLSGVLGVVTLFCVAQVIGRRKA